MVTLRTLDIMISKGMNGKLASKNFFWKWIRVRKEKIMKWVFQTLAKDRDWINQQWTYVSIQTTEYIFNLSSTTSSFKMDQYAEVNNFSFSTKSKTKGFPSDL